MSPSFLLLMLARIMQAIGASMFQATNIAIIAAYYPAGEKGKALGLMTTCVAIGAMAGPGIGGMIAEWLSWQWLFLIPVPLAAYASWLAIRHIKEDVRKPVKHSVFDWPGAAMLAWMVGSFIYCLSRNLEGGAGFGTRMNLLLLVVGVIVLPFFLYWERRHSSPIVPIALFRIRSVWMGLAVSAMSFIIANSLLVALPVHLYKQGNLTAASIGWMMLAYSLLLAVSSPLAGRWSDRLGSKPLMLAGLATMAGGTTYLLLQPGFITIPDLLLALGLNGVGMGFGAAIGLGMVQ